MWFPCLDKFVFSKEKPIISTKIQKWKGVHVVKVRVPQQPKQTGLSNSVIIYAHGNKWDLGRLLKEKVLHKLSVITKYPIVAFEYAGYGNDYNNSLSSNKSVENMLTIYKVLRHQYTNIYFYGFSMGTGVAVEALRQLIEDRQPVPNAIFLQGTFTSVMDTPEAKRKLGAFNSILKLFFNLFDVESILTHLVATNSIPIYFIHGTRDPTCPIAPIKKLASQLGANTIWIKDGGHNQLEDMPEFKKEIGETFTRV